VGVFIKAKTSFLVILLLAFSIVSFAYFHLNGQGTATLKGAPSGFNVGEVSISEGNASSLYYVYLAGNLSQWEKGYMNVSGIGYCNGHSPCLGMLFYGLNSTQYSSYPAASSECFWMVNTYFPLEQYWFFENGTIAQRFLGHPLSTYSKCWPSNVHGLPDGMVLETSQNFTMENGTSLSILRLNVS
jgi:uncharacterized membrane protein (UPF0127 family)